MTDEQTTRPKARYGFASMDPEKRRDIARKGGAAQRVRSFQKDPELAARAGRMGGEASGKARRKRASEDAQ